MNNESQILNVPIEDIIPNRFQPRLNFDENSLKELSASIKEHGIIQPLVLRRLGDKYEIIAGERRYKAAKMAGLTSVPAIISLLDDKKSAEVAIVENVQRKDLTSIEEAKSYKALLDKGYLTQDELAKKMGLSQSAISNKLRLLTLAETVQDAVMEGKISERHARSLLQVEDQEEQDKWLKAIIAERLTVKELDKRIKQDKDEKATNDEDIPIVELAPNIEIIKEKAEDIVTPNQDIVDVLFPNIAEEQKPIPNKFFNFLEDEQANMSMAEPSIEEVEFLDFDVSKKIEETPIPDKAMVYQKDMSIANGLIDKAINELQNSNYSVKLEKDEQTNEIKYTIIIDKN